MDKKCKKKQSYRKEIETKFIERFKKTQCVLFWIVYGYYWHFVYVFLFVFHIVQTKSIEFVDFVRFCKRARGKNVTENIQKFFSITFENANVLFLYCYIIIMLLLTSGYYHHYYLDGRTLDTILSSFFFCVCGDGVTSRHLPLLCMFFSSFSCFDCS